MKSTVCLVTAALVAMFGVAAGDATGSETIRNIPPTAHGAPAGATLDEIARAIGQAAGELQWYEESEEVGAIIVSTNVRRKHRATVEIGFDEVNFWIAYRNSSNLDYTKTDLKRWANGREVVIKKGPRIHDNYSLWVQNLADHISARTRVLIEDLPDRSKASDPVLIADELEKLDQLRVRGVLTQQEFDAQKVKLLAR